MGPLDSGPLWSGAPKNIVTFMCSAVFLLNKAIKPFKLVVKKRMRGWRLRRPCVSRRGLTHVLNMETLNVGL